MREESGVLESGCLIVGEKAMEELAGGACLGTEAWMAPLRNVGSGLSAGERVERRLVSGGTSQAGPWLSLGC